MKDNSDKSSVHPDAVAIPERLLARWLAGELSSQEARALKAWVAMNPDREKLLDEIREIWRQAGRLSAVSQHGKSQSWKKILSRLTPDSAAGS